MRELNRIGAGWKRWTLSTVHSILSNQAYRGIAYGIKNAL